MAALHVLFIPVGVALIVTGLVLLLSPKAKRQPPNPP
jgi:predicted phage tail protein